MAAQPHLGELGREAARHAGHGIRRGRCRAPRGREERAGRSRRQGYQSEPGAVIRVAIGLLAALALAACGKAERTDLPAPSPALWQVTAPDGKPAGWLFGTIHALPEGAKWRDSAIEKAIVDADLLVVEAKDLDDTGKLSAIFTRLSHSADMPPLSERVPAAMQGRLQALLKKGGYREADFKAIET